MFHVFMFHGSLMTMQAENKPVAATGAATGAAQTMTGNTSAMVLRECGICQSSIYTAEATHTCAKCGLVFHAECWQENLGCASYGCEQVNALAPKPAEAEQSAAPLPQPIVEALEPLPWSFLLLGAATLALMLSALTFGVPSMLTAGASGWRLIKKRHLRDRPLLWACALSLAGIF